MTRTNRPVAKFSSNAPAARVPAAAAARASPPKSPAWDAQDELNNRIYFRLFQVMNIYERQALRVLGFSGVQGAVMGALSMSPQQGVPFSELVEHLAVSRQNLDGVLKRLEALAYVERIENPVNRRVKLVRLTAKGGAAWQALIRDSLSFYREGMRDVSATEKAQFFDVLVRIGRGLRSIEPVADAK